MRRTRRLLGVGVGTAMLAGVMMLPALAAEAVPDTADSAVATTPADTTETTPDPAAGVDCPHGEPCEDGLGRWHGEDAPPRHGEHRRDGEARDGDAPRHGQLSDAPRQGRGEAPGRGMQGDARQARDGSSPNPGRGPGPGGDGAGEGPCAEADA